MVIGSIRQELLSGISDEIKFINLKDKLRAFDNLRLQVKDYEKAAEIFNTCRRNGVQGSHIDFLICAVAMNNEINIFTTDKDFENYKKYINIKLHATRKELNDHI